MGWIVGAVVVAIVAVVGGLWLKKQNAAAAAQREADNERETIRLREHEEANAAPSLVEDPDDAMVEAIRALGPRVSTLLSEFETLDTFQDVASWDARATSVASDAEDCGRQLAKYLADAESAVARYISASTDLIHVTSARLAKSAEITSHLSIVIGKIGKSYGDLLERVEQTPDNKKEQTALLKELRAEKKELQAQKKEVKAGAAQIRVAARQQSAEAGQGDLLGWPIYMRGVAAVERRAIRRAKERALGPHEDAVAALDRQIAAVDRRIAWVQRFGEAVDD